MNCAEFESQLSDYFDGALDATRSRAVQEHIAACQNCKMLAESLQDILLACRSYPELEPSAQLIERIIESAAARRRSPLAELLRPLLSPAVMPRVAVGALILFAFASTAVNFLGSKARPLAASALSPQRVIKKADMLTHRLYSMALRIYDRKNELQAELAVLKASILSRVDFHFDQLIEQLRPEPKGNRPGGEENRPDRSFVGSEPA